MTDALLLLLSFFSSSFHAFPVTGVLLSLWSFLSSFCAFPPTDVLLSLLSFFKVLFMHFHWCVTIIIALFQVLFTFPLTDVQTLARQGPIERWFARYVYEYPEKRYERTLHVLWEEGEKIKMRYCPAFRFPITDTHPPPHPRKIPVILDIKFPALNLRAIVWFPFPRLLRLFFYLNLVLLLLLSCHISAYGPYSWFLFF